jgi:hypothetical protein
MINEQMRLRIDDRSALPGIGSFSVPIDSSHEAVLPVKRTRSQIIPRKCKNTSG